MKIIVCTIYCNISYISETWKDPIKTKLYQALGLVAGTKVFLIAALVIHAVTKQKFFVIFVKNLALGSCITGGWCIAMNLEVNRQIQY